MGTTCKALLLALGIIIPALQSSGQITSAGARLEIRLAEYKPRRGLIKANSPDGNGGIYLHKTALVTDQDIIEVQVRKHTVPDYYLEGMKATGVKVDRDPNDVYELKLRFTKAAAERMTKATKKHIGKPLAILVDGGVISDPIVTGSITDEAVIVRGGLGFTKEEAQRLATGLNKK